MKHAVTVCNGVWEEYGINNTWELPGKQEGSNTLNVGNVVFLKQLWAFAQPPVDVVTPILPTAEVKETRL